MDLIRYTLKGNGGIVMKRINSKFAKNICIYTLLPVIGLGALAIAFDWISFGEEKSIDQKILEEKLERVGELTVAKYSLSSEETYEDYREIPVVDCNIPGTRNTMTIKYEGKVEYWYDLKSLKPSVDGKKIEIVIPENPVFLKKVYLKDTEILQSNNILNPIDANDVTTHNTEIENKLLKRAENEGICDEAKQELHNTIYNLYKEFDEHDGYKVNVVFK